MAAGDAQVVSEPRRRRPSVSGAWQDLRNRLIASPRFKRLAFSLPFIRPLAERNVRQVFDLLAGFVYSQTLFACVELGLLQKLAEGPHDASALGRMTDVPPDRLRRLLAAAAAVDLVEERRDGTYGLGLAGAVVASDPGLMAMIRHHRFLYADLADPLALVRGTAGPTELASYWPYAAADRPEALEGAPVTDYSALMSASQSMLADEILSACPFGRHRRLVDVGGGDGAFVAAAARRFPDLICVCFDLPAVSDRAAARFAAAGVGDRATAVGGSFLADPIPSADLVTLVRVALDHDDATVLQILRAVRRALPPDGTLVIAEPISGTAGAARITDAYFGLYLMAMGNGRSRTFNEFRDLLQQAGFSRARLVPTRQRLLCSLVVARA
ncbi:methyltransferase [Amorphus orientalis]|uniref:Demethylspheroidene O-methyltransferase n=1 Tax=Amorphus orientalis TaxID=649198 RepID=A0AAE3VP68_9HYPH|nr:methyltransferase [Amorphus orientalis]MDQ0315483.1 demethylspheroidene O-methyltransferase [Amorphus orientalis]